jgi:hypothetical protein
MPAHWPWDLPKRKNTSYAKVLEGIESTPELRKVLATAVNDKREWG